MNRNYWKKNDLYHSIVFSPNTIVSQNYQKFNFQHEFVVVFDNWFDNNWNFEWAFSFNSLTHELQ